GEIVNRRRRLQRGAATLLGVIDQRPRRDGHAVVRGRTVGAHEQRECHPCGQEERQQPHRQARRLSQPPHWLHGAVLTSVLQALSSFPEGYPCYRATSSFSSSYPHDR